MPLDAEAQKVEALVDVGDPRLLSDRRRPIGASTAATSSRSASAWARVASHEHHEVVRIADEAVGGRPLAGASCARQVVAIIDAQAATK